MATRSCSPPTVVVTAELGGGESCLVVAHFVACVGRLGPYGVYNIPFESPNSSHEYQNPPSSQLNAVVPPLTYQLDFLHHISCIIYSVELLTQLNHYDKFFLCPRPAPWKQLAPVGGYKWPCILPESCHSSNDLSTSRWLGRHCRRKSPMRLLFYASLLEFRIRPMMRTPTTECHITGRVGT